MKRSTLAFCLLLPLAVPGCPAFKTALKAAAEALPWLIDLVGDILGRDDYQAQLDAQVAEQGEEAVALAVREVWRRQVSQPQSRSAVLTLPAVSAARQRADRAELWLRRSGRWTGAQAPKRPGG